MRQAPTRELYEYWDKLRGDRLAPERGDIDPTAIRRILADTFLLEVDTAKRYPLRLSGTRFNALFLQDLKGRSFHRLWAESDRDDMADVLAYVCDDTAPVLAGVSAAPWNRAPMALELLLLPVRHLGKTHARILGCLTPASLPSWIGLLPVEQLSLQSLRVLPHHRGSRQLAPNEATGLVSLENTPHQRAPMRRGHLFVHQNEG
jgi:hypothetical protein